MKIKNENFVRVNVSLPVDVVRELDNACNTYGFSRAGYITFALKQKFNTDRALESMPETNKLLSDLLLKVDELKALSDSQNIEKNQTKLV